jgi:hypothetical protein
VIGCNRAGGALTTETIMAKTARPGRPAAKKAAAKPARAKTAAKTKTPAKRKADK